MIDDTRPAAEYDDENPTATVPAPTRAAPALAWSQGDDTPELPTMPLERRSWPQVVTWAAGVIAAAAAVYLGFLVASAVMDDRSDTAPSTVATATPKSAQGSTPASVDDPFSALAGRWVGHHRGVAVTGNTLELSIIDYAACPRCAAVAAPRAVIHIGLTSYSGDDTGDSGHFGGYVKDSSDPRVVPAGLPVDIRMEPASAFLIRTGQHGDPGAGRVLTFVIQGMPQPGPDAWNAEPLGDASPFCDIPATVCGA